MGTTVNFIQDTAIPIYLKERRYFFLTAGQLPMPLSPSYIAISSGGWTLRRVLPKPQQEVP